MLSIKGLSQLSPLFSKLGGVFGSLALGLLLSGEGFKKLFDVFTGGEAGEAVNWIKRIRQALSGGENSGEESGILDAFRDGALDKIKEQAQKTGEVLVSYFYNPRQAIRQLGTSIKGFAGATFAPLVSSVRGAGGVLKWLVMSPFALLRFALIGIGSVLGFLLSPIGLIIAALAGVALVVWKQSSLPAERPGGLSFYWR